jgi:predicted deacylase
VIAGFREASHKVGGRESVVGHSVEGRRLLRFDLGTAGKPTVLLSALMHGVEVVGSLTLLEVVRQLGDRSNDIASRLLEEAHFVVLPVVNPDAFVANMAKVARGERAWQRCNANGVDLNRNFAHLTTKRLYHPFSGSRFRKSPHYFGPHSFSEPETRAVHAVAMETRPVLSLAFHSFGNLILYPWAYTDQENPRAEEYRAIAEVMSRAMKRTPYRAKQARQLYSVVGDMDDWLDSELGTLALTIEVGWPDLGLRKIRSLTNPFAWMNPLHPAEASSDVAPAALALTAAALGLTPMESRPSKQRGAFLQLAAK